MLELVLNKRLRKNYNKVLKLQNADEIESFLAILNEKEKNELFNYTYGYAIRERQKMGIPITEYFLSHYDEFIPWANKDLMDKADKHMCIIFNIVTTIFVVAMLVFSLIFKFPSKSF